jgi:hypothetical protein
MAEKIKLVQGDTKPQIKCVVTDETTGKVVDMSGAEVKLKFREKGLDDVLFVLTGYLQSGLENAQGVLTEFAPGQAYAQPGKGGRVAFQFNPGNLNIEPGYYEGEIEITFPPPDGGVQTVYAPLKFQIREQF